MKKSQIEKSIKDFYDATEIPIGEMKDLIALSESHRQYEEERKDNSKINKFLKGGEEIISLSRALEIGNEMNLREYMLKVIESRYIPEEIKLKDVEEFKAIPSIEGLAEIYKIGLLKCFDFDPKIRSEIKIKDIPDDYYTKFNLNRYIPKVACVKKGFFTKRKELKEKIEKTTLGSFSFSTMYSREINLYNPLVLRYCGETLKKLESKFLLWNKGQYELITHYALEI